MYPPNNEVFDQDFLDHKSEKMDALANLQAEIAKKKQVESETGQAKPGWVRKADIEAARKRQYFAEEEEYEKNLSRKRLRLQEEKDALTKELKPGIEKWKNKGVNKESIQCLLADELASALAAFLVSYDLSMNEAFRKIESSLTAAFMEGFISGAVLVEAKGEDAEEIFNLVINKFRTIEGVGTTNLIGIKVRLRSFLNSAVVSLAEVKPLFPPADSMPTTTTPTATVKLTSPAEVTEADEEEVPASVENGPPQESDYCKEDYVKACVKHYLSLWRQEVAQLPDDKPSRALLERCNLTGEWLKPLEKLLEKRQLKKEVLDAVRNIFDAVHERDYVKANRAYLEQLAIGNSPWPMGATMVGIHARAAREKISEDKIAHVMNDEQTRKYVQAIKRLVTVAERHYPADAK